ncbi:MAG: DEAD/DEAH box helicase [Spirochaetes bacterium]|nr:DEAD/DEAH box helicase [Spirochaetota bacterium]
MDSFSSLGVRDDLSAALAAFGFEGPTDVQSAAMSKLFSGADAFVSSATGSGKTFAYLVPIAQGLVRDDRALRAVVVSPTHELASQIQREFDRLAAAAKLPFASLLAVGSVPVRRVEERLKRKPSIVVGSPGRLLDLFRIGMLRPDGLRFAVLDEADRLFEKETVETTNALLGLLPASCSRVLVSATIPDRVVSRASPFLRNPERVAIDNALALKTSILHWAFHRHSRKKVDFIRSFEAAAKPRRCLVFASSNAALFNISRKLEHHGFPVASLGAQADRKERKGALDRFRSGDIRYLVTSDLGARGIDVPDVDYVLNMDLPDEPLVYIHRAGRTGRAGASGISVIVADLVELKRASRIAMRYGFVFKCKTLENGEVIEMDPPTFFERAERDESPRVRE